jgi:hypothetical protein
VGIACFGACRLRFVFPCPVSPCLGFAFFVVRFELMLGVAPLAASNGQVKKQR